MTQAAILILSAAAMWLVSGRSRHAHLGWALGLASQPFWLHATWEAGQWGMFALAVFYSFAWAHGLWNHWPAPAIRPRPTHKPPPPPNPPRAP